MKKLIIIILTIHCSLFTIHCFSQDFKLIKATSQHWAGGVCCRYGINYVIQIETKSDKFNPDTAWINGNYYPLDFSVRPYPLNTKKYDSLKHIYVFSFTVRESHDDAPHPYFNNNIPKVDSAAIKAAPKKEFKGAALITYQKKKKQCTFVIKEFKVLPNLAYP
jgi:hypothetical protein